MPAILQFTAKSVVFYYATTSIVTIVTTCNYSSIVANIMTSTLVVRSIYHRIGLHKVLMKATYSRCLAFTDRHNRLKLFSLILCFSEI